MSRVIIDASGTANLAGREPALTHVVEANGKAYTVDSQYVPEGWYETMVFPAYYDGPGIYEERYDTYEEMEKNHTFIIENLEAFIGGENEKSSIDV